LPASQKWVWLSQHRDLRQGSDWLLIDNFSGVEWQPYLGSWSPFDNGQQGGTAKLGAASLTGTGESRHLVIPFDLGIGGYQFCGLEWIAGEGSVFNGAQKFRYRAKADKRTVVDFHLVQSDIGDDNYFGALDTLTTEWKTFEHNLKDFRGRLGNREGEPNLEKGTAFRWHIQFDKNAGLTSGTVFLDEVHIGGTLATMYSAPEAALPQTGSPPFLNIQPRLNRKPAQQPPTKFRGSPLFRGWLKGMGFGLNGKSLKEESLQ
jgi:hypothetical protein